MDQMFSGKRIVLLLALLAAIALAIFVFWPKDDLAHLKQTAEVTTGTEAAVDTVRRIVAAAGAKDPRRALAEFMYVRDATEQERITAPLTEAPPLGELKFLGCDKLVVSHSDYLTVHAYSAARDRSYAFGFIRDPKGVYKLSGLGFSKRRP